MAANSTAPTLLVGASARGGVLGLGGVIDAPAATYALRRKVVRIPLPATLLVASATTKHSLGAHGITGNIIEAYVTYGGAANAAGGVVTGKLVDFASSVETDLTTAASLVGRTLRVPFALTAVATPPNVVATGGLELHVTCDATVVTQPSTAVLTVVFDPNEPSTISQ